MSNARSRDLIKQDGLSGRREARFFALFWGEKAARGENAGGVYGMLQVLRAIGHGMCTVRDVSDEW